MRYWTNANCKDSQSSDVKSHFVTFLSLQTSSITLYGIKMGPEIDVGALAQLSSENLRVLLRKIAGTKDLIIEPSLIPPLDKIAGMSLFKSCYVDRVFKLEQGWPDASASSTKVYFVRPSLQNAKIIVEHLQMSSNIQKGLMFHVIFLPKVVREVEIFLEEEGAYGKITVHDYLWELIPLDYDLLSLEMNNFYSSLFVDEEASLLPAVAHSIQGVQTLFGQIKNRIAVGKNAITVLDQLQLLEGKQPANHGVARDISTLLIVDRSVDYASLLLSPLTYEALLNEVFANICGSIDLDERVTKGDHVKLQLTSKDKMFAKIRAQHFTNIFASLSSYAKQLKASQSKAANLSINEMKSFVQKELKDIQTQSRAVALHIGACEVINEEKGPIYEHTLPLEHGIVTGNVYKESLLYLEEAMAQRQPKDVVLRLMCLLSFCNNGISASDYDRIKHQFLQTYGFDKLSAFHSLKKMGLLTSREALVALKASVRDKTLSGGAGPGNFLHVAKKLNLNAGQNQSMVASSQMQEDVSYVFNGAYIPIICKLARDAKDGNLEETVKELKVPYKIKLGDEKSTLSASGKVVFIYFVGGYTFSEVAAFRHLQTILGNQFIIAGTSSISGKNVMDHVLNL